MTSKFRCALPLALGLAVPSIVSAAETPLSPPAIVASASPGVMTETNQSGFAMVTFGIWPGQDQDRSSSQSLPTADRLLRDTRTRDEANRYRRILYLPHVRAAERQYALPPGLLDALIWTESRYNPFAISQAGAVGLGQLMPATAQAVGVANRYDPKTNLGGSARYLRQMLEKFRAIHLAIAAYNAGPRAIEAAGGIPNNGETPRYVSNVLAAWRKSAQ